MGYEVELTETHEKRAVELFDEEQIEAILTIHLQRWIDEQYNQKIAGELEHGTE